MGKRSVGTTNTVIRNALRKIFMQSRERSAAIKRDNYSCVQCGVKQSKAKGREMAVHVHHIDGIHNYDEIYAAIRKELLCSSDRMETLCAPCHDKLTEQQRARATMGEREIDQPAASQQS